MNREEKIEAIASAITAGRRAQEDNLFTGKRSPRMRPEDHGDR